VSNVFAAEFLPYRSNKEIISGGNDADMRHYDLEKKTCTVYTHHTKKVLRLSVNPLMPDTFLSCSADGTIRMIDIRQKYPGSITCTFDQYFEEDEYDYVLPQAFGGGRALRQDTVSDVSSLVLDYRMDSTVPRHLRRITSEVSLFSVDFHPTDGHSFIVGSGFGDVRLYDLRKIETNPAKCYVNMYRNWDIPYPCFGYEITGCVFSKNGSEIVATALEDYIYVFDTNTNFAKIYNLNNDDEKESNVENTKKRKKSSSGEPASKKLKQNIQQNIQQNIRNLK